MGIILLVLVSAYLLGAVPTAHILVKAVYGRDIRRMGSGNVGGMNVARNVSLGLGLAIIILDVAKGALAVILANTLTGSGAATVLASLLVVAGHNWSIFLGFKGGKGIAAALGVLLVLKLGVSFWLLLVVALASLLTRDVNLGSIIGFGIFPLIAWWQMGNFGWFFYGLVFAALVIAKHIRLPRVITYHYSRY